MARTRRDGLKADPFCALTIIMVWAYANVCMPGLRANEVLRIGAGTYVRLRLGQATIQQRKVCDTGANMANCGISRDTSKQLETSSSLGFSSSISLGAVDTLREGLEH
jgi:hypothetical protein